MTLFAFLVWHWCWREAIYHIRCTYQLVYGRRHGDLYASIVTDINKGVAIVRYDCSVCTISTSLRKLWFYAVIPTGPYSTFGVPLRLPVCIFVLAAFSPTTYRAARFLSLPFIPFTPSSPHFLLFTFHSTLHAPISFLLRLKLLPLPSPLPFLLIITYIPLVFVWDTNRRTEAELSHVLHDTLYAILSLPVETNIIITLPGCQDKRQVNS